MALVEHPELCPSCPQWIDVVDRRLVNHEVFRGPRNAHERRSWKKHGKPLCPGSGAQIRVPTLWVEVPD